MSEEPSRPGLDTLADYLEGLLSEAENREVERWVTEDATTAELLHELERLPGLLAADPVGPMPPDVVARVDAALAESVRAGGDRAADAPRGVEEKAGAVVVPLRRRRWLAPALAAAVTVSVVAIGAQVVSSVGPTGGDDAQTSAGRGTADRADDGHEEAEGGNVAPDSADGPTSDLRYSLGMLPPVRTGTFATDVADALGNRRAGWLAGERAESDAGDDARDSFFSAGCSVELGAGRVLPIRLDGELAVLLLRRIPGAPGRREALAYPARCGDLEAQPSPQPLVRAVVTLP